MHLFSKSTLALSMAMVAAAGLSTRAATITKSADITADETWTSNNVYVLDKPIFVRSGATLTIEAGTLVRGEKETNTDPGALVICRGAKIKAMGTADAPIIMTNMDDDWLDVGGTGASNGYENRYNGICRTWGGLILLGDTYLATKVGEPGTPSPDASLELQIEGLEPYGAFSKYGGGDDDDDSGEIHYVSIRYGGFVLGDANEINGVTMGAVGRGTAIDHVEVYQNKDDGFEFFGGTVNTKYLIAHCVGDDSFDWDEGFRGKNQFWLTIQGPIASESDISDKGGELDGGNGDTSQPSSCPTIYNATFIGTGKASGRTKNTAMHFRDGTGGRFYNSLFMDFGGACALIEGDADGLDGDSADKCLTDYPTGSPYYMHEANGSKMLELKNNYFWNMGLAGVPSTDPLTWGCSSGDETKPHYAYPLFSDTSLTNTYLSSTYSGQGQATDAPVGYFSRSEETAGIDIGGTIYYVSELLDLRLPEGSPLATAGRTPPSDGFFTPVSFVGAFAEGDFNAASPAADWTGPWSLAWRMSVLDTAVTGDYSDLDELVIDQFDTVHYLRFQSVPGTTYEVQSSTNAAGPWTTVDTIVGDGSRKYYTEDPSAATPGTIFYQVVKQ